MKRTGKIVAWLCILSTFFTGCYSSVLVKPDGNEKAKIYSNYIKYAIAKEGTKYIFEKPPAIVNDTIVGDAKVKVAEGMMMTRVAMPVSDVVEASVLEKSGFWTTVAITSGILVGTYLVLGVVWVAAGGTTR
jgi:hypothetical protein